MGGRDPASHRGSYGATERRLLETTAASVYANAVTHGSLQVDDPRLAAATEQRPALDLLLEIGLLRLDSSGTSYLPVDPAVVQPQIVVPLGQQGVELLTESARWADTFNELGQTFRASPQASVSPITEIHGLGNINSFIQAAVNDCRRELLTAQPAGRRKATTLAVAGERDIKALERGVKMRTLYQHPARHSPPTREYVADIVARGAEVRTLDEFFKRLIVVDRQLAIIPGPTGNSMAVAVRDQALIAYLIDIFERSWERAQPFTGSGNQVERNIAADVRAMTIRMLVEGHSDPAGAKRLGVSPRTYAGYIASLKDEYAVETRFQLGHAMGRETGANETAGAGALEGEDDQFTA